MAQWLVNQKDNQFGVDSLNALKQLAADGRLGGGDMVQPPGATDWLYASEIPELKGLIREPEDYSGGGMSDTMKTLAALGVAGGLLLAIVVGTSLAALAYSQMPSGNESVLGEGGLSYSEMLVTANGAPLHGEPTDGSAALASLDKDSSLELLAKRGDFYKARTKDGKEGWIKTDQVIPMYQLGDRSVQADYDPLYNPDRYVEVGNAAWMLAEGSATKTVFRFQMTNKSKYDMTDLKLLATVKDGKGAEIERVEFPVVGIIPAASNAGDGSTMVGTLMPEDKKHGEPELLTEATFQERAQTDPDMQLRWVDGVEVEMKTKDFAVATIDLVEIRAVPKGEATPQ
jgi:hypothetical protein